MHVKYNNILKFLMNIYALSTLYLVITKVSKQSSFKLQFCKHINSKLYHYL